MIDNFRPGDMFSMSLDLLIIDSYLN